MTFIEYFNEQFSLQQQLVFGLRLVVACLCGAIVGYERSKHFVGGGIRAHSIVCCAAALIMIVSKYAFLDLTSAEEVVLNGARSADPARIAAQVVSGIGFLGAGVIFRNEGIVKGLTAAACIWATAAIGLAVGAGMWTIAVAATVLITAFQWLLNRFTGFSDTYATNHLHFTVENGHEFNQSLTEQLKAWKVHVVNSKINRKKDGTTDFDLTVRGLKEIRYAEIKDFMERHEEILSASNSSL